MKTRKERQLEKAALVQRLADEYIAVSQALHLAALNGHLPSIARLSLQMKRLSVRIYRARADMLELSLPLGFDGEDPPAIPTHTEKL